MLVRRSLPILATLALAGCGTAANSAGSFQGEARSVAKVIDDLSSAASGRDAAKICDGLLTANLKATLSTPGSDCQRAITHQFDDTDNYNVTVQKVNVTGTSATAQVKSRRSGKDHLDTVTLVKQGSSWRISGLGG